MTDTAMGDNRAFAGAIFDLDGVVTDTARVHAAAWKALFDEFLSRRARRHSEDYQPFSLEVDYPAYVDGKSRYDGVQSFLRSRGMELAFGDPTDSPQTETVCGLGNRKNALFGDVLRRDGVVVFDEAAHLIGRLKETGVRIALASSSRNARVVLQVAMLERLFDVIVDGQLAVELGLEGKPAPDTFLEAAALLGVLPESCVVVEDAISGVEAGKNGGFGLVVGVDRDGAGSMLLEHGADVVVPDFRGVEPADISRWFEASRKARAPGAAQ